jgi:uncharacterized cupin superfamily protein
MLIIGGSVTLIDTAGAEHSFEEGDFFVIPKGLVCAWSQPRFVRKYYCVAVGVDPAPHVALDLVRIHSKDITRAVGASLANAGMDIQFQFESPSRCMTAGAFQIRAPGEITFGHQFYELVCLDEGLLQIRCNGKTVTLRSSDAAALPPCATVTYNVLESVRGRFARVRE